MKALMLGIAILTSPAAAAGVGAEVPACATWSATMQEDEGGEALVASACARDAPETRMQLSCGAGTMLLRYDLALGSDRQPDYDEVRDVTFNFADDRVTLSMAYEDLDGMFAARFAPDAPIVAILRQAREMVVTAGAAYPDHGFNLDGSGKAIDTLLAQCD